MNKNKRAFAFIGLFLLLNVQCQFQFGHSNLEFLYNRGTRILQNSAFTISPSEVSFLTESYITFQGISQPQDVTKIELVNPLQAVELKILQTYPNSIKGYFTGGIQGNFNGRVTLSNGSKIESSNSVTIRVKINSITPNQGNYKGGVLLTIKGLNFSFISLQNTVSIGEVECKVLISSDKEIQCVTQPALNLLNQKKNVVLKSGNLVSETENAANTEFTFVETQKQPTISKIGSNYVQYLVGETVLIDGTNLFADEIETFLYIGERKIEWKKTDNGLSFVVPYDINKEVQKLSVYVGPNGQTQPQDFQVGVLITKMLCLNPSNKLIVQNSKTSVIANISGISESSIIEAKFDNVIIIQQSYDSIITQTGIIQTYYLSYQTAPTKIISLLVDGINVIETPIELEIVGDRNFQLNFDVSVHPDDSSYFQMKLISNQSNLNLEIYEILALSDNKFEQMIKENSTTFKLKRFDIKTKLNFRLCTNFGLLYYYSQNQKLFYKPLQNIIKLSLEEKVITGDILKFKIPLPKQYLYSMNVLCSNKGSRKPFNRNDDSGEAFSNFIRKKDIYQVFSHKQNGDEYEFKLPTILKRPLTKRNTCDIIIAKNNPATVLQYQQKDIEYYQTKSFVEQFIKQEDLNPDANYDEDLAEINDIGENSIYYNTPLEVFDNVILPQKFNLYVSQIEPKFITAYGREKIVITGKNFLLNNNDVSTTKVQLQGIDCQVQSLTNTQIICISGEKNIYDPLEILRSYVLIGREEAFMFSEVTYIFNFSDKVAMKYTQNEFLKSKSIYVPKQFGLIIDIGDEFQESNISLNIISVDGLLIFTSKRNQNVMIKSLSGKGVIKFGTDESRINSKLNIIIKDLSICGISAFGKKTEKFNYKLKNSFNTASKVLELQENNIQLQKGNKIMVLAKSIEENNEIFKVDSINGSQVTVTVATKSDYKNINESHQQQNGNSFQFNIETPVLLLDRSLSIKILGQKSDNISIIQFNQVYDTNIEIEDSIRIDYFVNSIIIILKPYLPEVNIQYSKQSIILAQYENNYIIQVMENSYLINISSISIQSDLQGLTTISSTNNFIQGGVNLRQYELQKKENSIRIQEFSNNIIVKSTICLTVNILYSYGLKYITKMNQNICFSAMIFTNQLQINLVDTTGLAVAGLDIRQQIFTQTVTPYQKIDLKSSPENQIQKQTKFFLVANTKSNPNNNLPIIAKIEGQQKSYVPFYLYQYELQGFSLQQNIQIVIQNGLNLVEIFNFKSDLSQDYKLYDTTIDDTSKGLVIVDRDGSLTGNVQTLLTKNLVRPQLNCSQNDKSQQNCSKQIGIIQVGFNIFRNYQEKFCIQNNNYDKALFVNGQKYTNSDNFITILEEITEFSFLDVNEITKENIPCYFELSPQYFQDISKSFIVKYKLDMTKFDVVISEPLSQLSNNQRIIEVSSLNKNCQHGQYQIQPDGVQICITNGQSNLGFLVQTKGMYPYVLPEINDFQNQVNKVFTQPEDWKVGQETTQLEKKWIIKKNWNMVLDTEGVITVPSLEIKGTLTIDLKGKTATIKSKGISISGGQIIIQSGNIIFELIDDANQTAIFKNIITEESFAPRSFLIFGKFITNINEQAQILSTYRVSSINQSNKKQITIEQQASGNYFNVGDALQITSPITSETISVFVSKIVSGYNSATKTITLEIDQEYTYSQQFLKKTFIEKDFDFRPIVAKINRQVVIKNAKIYINSYEYKVIPEVIFNGVQFINSSIEIARKFKKISIQNSSFQSTDMKNLIDKFVFINKTVWKVNQYKIGDQEEEIPQLTLANNLFSFAKKHIEMTEVYEAYTYVSNSFGGFNFLIENYEQLRLETLLVSFDNNIFIGASQVALEINSPISLKENIIIKASSSCLKTSYCLKTSFDQLFDCGNYGIESYECQNYSNILVAKSKLFASSNQATFNKVVSLENNIHFQLNVESSLDNSKVRIRNSISQSAISFNTFFTSGNCIPQSLLSVSLASINNYYQLLASMISDTKVYDFNCPQNIIFKLNSQSGIQPFINLSNSQCINCQMGLKDLISLGSAITNLPTTFRVQDDIGKFLNSNSQKPQAYLSQVSAPYFKQSDVEKALVGLYITQRNMQQETVKQYFKLNDQKFDIVSSLQYTFAYVQGKQSYTLAADKDLSDFTTILESPSPSKNYVILKIKTKESYQLVIKNNLQIVINPTPINLSQPSTDLLQIAGSEQKLICGMNIQDKDTLENFVVITSEENCRLRFSEVLSTVLKFKAATPILPPPTPEEESMCDADRRVLYIIKRISQLLGIDQVRIRLLGRTQSICLTRLRILEESVDDYIFVIDPISTTLNQNENIKLPTDKQEQALKEQKSNDILDMVNVINNINNLYKQTSVDTGLKVANIDVQIPKFDVSNICTQGKFRELESCVDKCSPDYFASSQICLLCDSSCKGCTGISKYDCKACADGAAQMTDSIGVQYCGKCSDNCQSCINDQQCTQCSQGYLLSDGICVSKCLEGKFSSNGKCQICPKGCKTCSSELACITCQSGKILNSTKQCVDNTIKPPTPSQPEEKQFNYN